ncbi:MAG: UDP-N-acetylmuramoyl-L-alanine--D-glutamate ligase [Candidatus Paceibacterota bacterium]
MSSFEEYFKGKRITLMGLGLLGRGVGDARFLAEQGAEVTVTDLKTKEQLKENVEKLKNFKNIRFVLGEHRMEDFQETDMVVKGAGVPLDSKYIEKARESGVLIRMSSALFAELTPATVIGITGTKGKTTVSYLLHHILKKAGKETFLGGNARLISTLAHLPESEDNEFAVLELDSWQLQGFAEAGISPSFAVFTNFMPDHLDYYKGNTSLYFKDKAAVFLNQKKTDVLVTTEGVYHRIKEECQILPSGYLKVVSSDEEYKTENPALLGRHNRLNAVLATLVAKTLGISETECQKGVDTFPGVSGRMAFIGKTKGVTFYNDNNATTPDAAVAAIKTLAPEGRLLLIAGGADKNLPITELKDTIEHQVFRAFLLPGSGTDRLTENMNSSVVLKVADIEEAVAKVAEIAKEGDIVLFSPAFASFSQFKNEYEREDVFLKKVKERFHRIK